MNVVTATKSNNTITVLVNDNGQIKPIPAPSDHPKWTEILKAWTESNYEALLELLSMKRIVEKFSNGDLVVSDNGVFYKDMPLAGIDVDRLMAFLRRNEPYFPIANYMARKLKNPSRRAINEMYNFLEHREMPLTPQGTILAYKGVLPNFFSVSSGKEPLISGRRNEGGQIFNGVGEVIEMDRAWVDDDFRKGCSGGLHAGSLEYAKDWARSHNGIIILIEIDPADVVSVPEDCNCTKLRCCKYRVIGIYAGPLPDTYTADYSPEPVRSCPTCDSTDCSCEEETCDECGNSVDYCSCESDETCGHCGDRLDVCSCGQSQNSDPAAATIDHPTDLPDRVLNPTPKESAREILGLDEKGDEIRQKFVALVCEQLGVSPDNVTDNKSFIEDLGADSLDTVELVMFVEEEFQIEVPDEVAEQCDTVGKAIAEIRRLQGLCPCPLNQSCTCSEPPQPVQVSPLDVMEKNLDNVLSAVEQNEKEVDTYQRGYELGFRNGVRRRKRLYREGAHREIVCPADAKYAEGYSDGYRAGRKDYKH